MRAWRRLIALLILSVLTSRADAEQDAGTRAKQAYAQAVELEKKGNHDAALARLWEAAGLSPRDPDIQNHLGEALERLGALDAAVAAYRVAVAERPRFRHASNNLILVLGKAGKHIEAVQLARRLAAEAPDDPERLFTLGLAQSEPDVAAAIASFRRTLELNPRHTLARYNLALVLRRADRLAEAVEELQRALAIEPRAEAYYTLGIIRWHQGDLDGAAGALRAAVGAQPGHVEAHAALGGVLKARRDSDGAAAALRSAIALRPDLASSHYALGQILRLEGDERGARTAFGEAERLRRRGQQVQEASVLTALGTQKLEAGDLEGALGHLRHATTVFDEYAPAHYQVGRVLQQLGQEEAARAAFTRARQLNPSLVPPPVTAYGRISKDGA